MKGKKKPQASKEVKKQTLKHHQKTYDVKIHSKEKTEQQDKRKYFEAVGRRKTSVARVRLELNGSGIKVNDKDYKVYFPYHVWQEAVEAPVQSLQPKEKFGISVKVRGGGINSQAEAVRHGIARAMLEVDEEYRRYLRKLGFLTRDPRMKERRKYGLKKARRAPQWAKR
ncbi:30S ribosomal protein S9 [Candidatus Parcubacteria bacterium]|nr:MAG: 30S ribosomal protein S9 [Candidatus Parcubacteria bacterium]